MLNQLELDRTSLPIRRVSHSLEAMHWGGQCNATGIVESRDCVTTTTLEKGYNNINKILLPK